jgi:hypothetical protein
MFWPMQDAGAVFSTAGYCIPSSPDLNANVLQHPVCSGRYFFEGSSIALF